MILILGITTTSHFILQGREEPSQAGSSVDCVPSDWQGCGGSLSSSIQSWGNTSLDAFWRQVEGESCFINFSLIV